MITSKGNSRVRNVIALQKKAKERIAQDVFVVEGARIAREIPADRLLEVYLSESFLKKTRAPRFPGHVRMESVTDDVFGAMSDTKTPQGIICVVRRFRWPEESLTGSGWPPNAVGQSGDAQKTAVPPFCLALEDIQDPGNLGTMIRTAEGAGVTGILMSEGCADIYNPKVIRSTMGSIFRVPFFVSENFRESILRWKQQGIRICASRMDGSIPYTEADCTGPTALMIGNEGSGLTEETAALADLSLRIPMKGKVESLNASAAASVLLYETARQRGLAE